MATPNAGGKVERGVGSGEWGVGSREKGMGSGEWGRHEEENPGGFQSQTQRINESWPLFLLM